MKKILFGIIMLSLLASMAFAQEIKPYGSARIGYWYEMPNKDYTGTEESDLDLNYGLQGNSRFGVNFKKDDLTAKVEYGTGVNLRLLYAKLNMGSYSILIGQDYDGLNEYAGQVYGNDKNLIGYGVIDGGRNPQIKFEYENGLYFAFIKPTIVKPYADNNVNFANSDILFPRFNIGMKAKMDNFYIHPTLMLQHFSYNKKENAINDDFSVISYIFAVTGQMNMDALMLRAQFNYGSNVGNMGLLPAERPTALATNIAYWNNDEKEMNNASTLGGFFELGYKVSDMLTIDGGVGYTSNDMSDIYEKADSKMSLYLQGKIKTGYLQIIPEIGMIDDMKYTLEQKEGSKMYFGTQLRMDF